MVKITQLKTEKGFSESQTQVLEEDGGSESKISQVPPPRTSIEEEKLEKEVEELTREQESLQRIAEGTSKKTKAAIEEAKAKLEEEEREYRELGKEAGIETFPSEPTQPQISPETLFDYSKEGQIKFAESTKVHSWLELETMPYFALAHNDIKEDIKMRVANWQGLHYVAPEDMIDLDKFDLEALAKEYGSFKDIDPLKFREEFKNKLNLELTLKYLYDNDLLDEAQILMFNSGRREDYHSLGFRSAYIRDLGRAKTSQEFSQIVAEMHGWPALTTEEREESKRQIASLLDWINPTPVPLEASVSFLQVPSEKKAAEIALLTGLGIVVPRAAGKLAQVAGPKAGTLLAKLKGKGDEAIGFLFERFQKGATQKLATEVVEEAGEKTLKLAQHLMIERYTNEAALRVSLNWEEKVFKFSFPENALYGSADEYEKAFYWLMEKMDDKGLPLELRNAALSNLNRLRVGGRGSVSLIPQTARTDIAENPFVRTIQREAGEEILEKAAVKLEGIYDGAMPTIIEEAQKGKISSERLYEVLAELQRAGVVIDPNPLGEYIWDKGKLVKRVYDEKGRLVIPCWVNDQELLTHLVETEQDLKALESGVPLERLRHPSIYNEAAANIQKDKILIENSHLFFSHGQESVNELVERGAMKEYYRRDLESRLACIESLGRKPP